MDPGAPMWISSSSLSRQSNALSQRSKRPCVIPGGRGSVRAGLRRGSPGGSPSKIVQGHLGGREVNEPFDQPQVSCATHRDDTNMVLPFCGRYRSGPVGMR